MNTIYYANLKTGKREAIKVARDYKYLDERRVSWKRKVNPRTTRRPTMAEADEKMHGRGFVRWSKKKEMPGFQEIRLPRAA